MKKRRLGRGVSIVGAGMTKFGMFKDRDSKDLFAEAFTEMLSSVDKGLDPADIDALYLGNFSNDFFTHQSHWGPLIADIIGHVPKAGHAHGGRLRLERACLPGGGLRHRLRVLRPGARRRGRRHVQAHHRGGGRRAGAGRRALREPGRIHLSRGFRGRGHRLFRQVRGKPRAPHECHHQEPPQRAAQPQGAVSLHRPRHDERQDGQPQKARPTGTGLEGREGLPPGPVRQPRGGLAHPSLRLLPHQRRGQLHPAGGRGDRQKLYRRPRPCGGHRPGKRPRVSCQART